MSSERLVTNYVSWYNQFYVTLILHSLESTFLLMFIFYNSVLCSTLKEFININSRKNFDYLYSIYTLDQLHDSERLHSSYSLLDSCTKISSQITWRVPPQWRNNFLTRLFANQLRKLSGTWMLTSAVAWQTAITLYSMGTTTARKAVTLKPSMVDSSCTKEYRNAEGLV